MLAEDLDHRLEVRALVAGGVEHHVEVAGAALEDAAHAVDVAAVGLELLDAGRQVGLTPAAVEDRHLMAGCVQCAQESQSDEAGAAEEERSHGDVLSGRGLAWRPHRLDRPFYSE